MISNNLKYLLLLLCYSVFSQSPPRPSADFNKNYISSISFDLRGVTLSKSVNYFNSLGKSTQSQTWDLLTNRIWASETLYDYQGRPALQTLSAPIGNNFGLINNFISDSNGSTYNALDFDTSNKLSNPSTVSTRSKLGWYYSSLNTDQFNSGNSFQDTTSYPFSRTVFSRLTPGTVKEVLGGNKVDTNNDGNPNTWLQSYTFQMPIAQELFYAFGLNAFPQRDVIVGEPTGATVQTTPSHYYYTYTLRQCNSNTSITNVRVGFSDYDLPLSSSNNPKVFKIRYNGVTNYYYATHRQFHYDDGGGDDCLSLPCDPYDSQLNANLNNAIPSSNSAILQSTNIYDSCPYGRPYYILGNKTVSRDVHGIETVLFTDSEGNTLAAARSGNEENTNQRKYKVLSPIGKQGYVDIHIPVGCGGTVNFKGGDSRTRFKILDLITEQLITSNARVNYVLTPGVYRIEERITSFHKSENPYVTIQNQTISLLNPASHIGVEYNVNYYDYSLNYYDKANRLTRSVQPLGFDDKLDLTPNRNHTLSSNFDYNSLGQLLETTSPDEGEAKFKYRTDGQIRFSQNSKQQAAREFSYTNYDALGRPIESGVLVSNAFSSVNPDNNALPTGARKEQHFTQYDTLNPIELVNKSGLNPSYHRPKFLSGNVAKTSNAHTTTYYSYDVYGRVSWLIQDIEDLGLKTIDYEYDFARGHVSKVIYQKYNPSEYFEHRYTYNNASQLVAVHTTTNGKNYTEHAKYFYYENGALKRTEIAEDLQGIDYVYNLSGQLKAINSPLSQGFKDPGNDGINNNFKPDVFGMILDYHNQDYIRNATYLQGLKNTTTQNQFNGNISSQRWRNDTPLQPKVDTYNYQYNKNYWLSQANFGSYQLPSGNNFPNHITNNQAIPTNSSRSDKASVSITLQPGFTASLGTKYHAKIIPNGGFNNEGGDYDVTGITYDANGNIESLKRNKNTENGSNAMDDLNYVYKTDKPNQLLRVEDNEGNAGVGDIDTQTGDNYHYNSIGQLKENLSENLRYAYNASGLVTEVAQLNGTPIVKFYYNDKNHRVKKESYNTQGGNLQNTTYYVRDASGTPLAIYTKQANAPTQLAEHTIYGASRLGVHYRQDNTNAYQLTDHLGNVRAVIVKQGNAAAALTAKTDYYPFGMPMPNRNIEGNYRYGYQGEYAEKEPELGNGQNSFELRLWDSRIGRWMSPDPAGVGFTPYFGMNNNPISEIDPDGACPCSECPENCGGFSIPAAQQNLPLPVESVSSLSAAGLTPLSANSTPNAGLLSFYNTYNDVTSGFQNGIVQRIDNFASFVSSPIDRTIKGVANSYSSAENFFSNYASVGGDFNQYMFDTAYQSVSSMSAYDWGFAAGYSAPDAALSFGGGYALSGLRLTTIRIPVYRTFGGISRAQGYSWSVVNPRLYGSTYRNFAGLPNGNTANFMIKGHVEIHNIMKFRLAKPLDGNIGTFVPEVIINPDNVVLSSFRVLKK